MFTTCLNHSLTQKPTNSLPLQQHCISSLAILAQVAQFRHKSVLHYLHCLRTLSSASQWFLALMMCQGCGEIKQMKAWWKPMWYSAKEVPHKAYWASPYEGALCKQCQALHPGWEGRWLGPWDSTSSTVPKTTWGSEIPGGSTSTHCKGAFAHEGSSNDQDIQELRSFSKQASRLEPLIRLLMAQTSRKTRKEWSYNGAVRCRSLEEEHHYVCVKTGIRYFDPTNWLYAVCFNVLFRDTALSSENWNNETKGDIFECILGYCYLSENNHLPQYMDKWRLHISVVGALLDHVIYHFWSLLQRIHYKEGRWPDFLAVVQELCDTIHDGSTCISQVIPSALAAIALEDTRPKGARRLQGGFSSVNPAVKTLESGVLYSKYANTVLLQLGQCTDTVHSCFQPEWVN